MPGHHPPHEEREAPQPSPERFWEERYAGRERLWSGRPNAHLVRLAAPLTPGSALDLGCGEGADVIWLARRGWRATGLDISPTAVRRAARAAEAAGLSADRADFRVADLSRWRPEERYGLVAASFLHSPVELPRERILRAAAEAVAPGGRLLLVSHAAPPPWMDLPEGYGHRFPGVEEQLAVIAPEPGVWERQLAEVRERETRDPEGRPAVLLDAVLLLRRRPDPAPDPEGREGAGEPEPGIA